MKRLAAAITAFVAIMLAACDDPVAPPQPRIRTPTQPVFDHTSNAFAIAIQSCFYTWYYDEYGDFYEYSYQCHIVVPHSGGTASVYGNGDPSWLLRPTWSPDATKIAADNDDDVLVITLSDGSIANLTNFPARDHSPAWSPDGGRIAFVSDRDGQPSLYLMRAADGGDVMRLTSGVEVFLQPTWSPDGLQLAFACVVESGNNDVCAVNVDGSGFVRLTSTPSSDFGPDWSPDGTRIAFVTYRFTAGAADIATMAPDGTNITRLSQSSSYSGYSGPDWSPGGTRIAYSEAAGGYACPAFGPCPDPQPSLFVMNADGSGAGSIGSGSHPEWRPTAADAPTTDESPAARFTYSCTNLDCVFYGSTSTDDHGIREYRWTFGDGTAGQYAYAGHTYAAAGTYQVTLTVLDWDGHTGSVTQDVTTGPAPPDQPPVASFSWSCRVGRACDFNSSGSWDDRGIVLRTWTFGDGSSVNDVIAPSHTYAVNGTYDVTLTVRDAAGQTSSVTQSVTAVDNPPVARLTYSCTSTSCTFDGAASTDDWGIASYRWDLGRYGTAEGSSVMIGLRGRSPITATLTVADQAGQTSSTTQTVTFK